jgi:hypothetical protein
LGFVRIRQYYQSETTVFYLYDRFHRAQSFLWFRPCRVVGIIEIFQVEVGCDITHFDRVQHLGGVSQDFYRALSDSTYFFGNSGFKTLLESIDSLLKRQMDLVPRSGTDVKQSLPGQYLLSGWELVWLPWFVRRHDHILCPLLFSEDLSQKIVSWVSLNHPCLCPYRSKRSSFSCSVRN